MEPVWKQLVFLLHLESLRGDGTDRNLPPLLVTEHVKSSPDGKQVLFRGEISVDEDASEKNTYKNILPEATESIKSVYFKESLQSSENFHVTMAVSPFGTPPVGSLCSSHCVTIYKLLLPEENRLLCSNRLL